MNEIITKYICDICDSKSFRDKSSYERHCNTNIHRLRTSGLTKEDATKKRKEDTNIKISNANKEWARTHDNPRKGVKFTELQKESCREKAIERLYGNNVLYLSETHPELIKEWHPTKNGDKIPSKYTAGSDAKIYWLCPNKCSEGCLHEYEQTIANRVNGSTCPYCSEPPKKICIHDSIIYTHPDIAKEWHPIKNTTLIPDNITYGSKKMVWWLCMKKCPEGCNHEYLAAPTNRCGINQQNCPFCCNQQICIHTSIQYTHPDIAKEWHPTKNGDRLPSQYSKGSTVDKIWWKCENNHEWQAIIKNRCLANSGCPHCYRRYSKQQMEWLQYCSITHPDIQYAEHYGEYRIPGTGFLADGFHSETNTIYEYQGDYWHGNPLIFNPSNINPSTGTTYGFLYERTQKKIGEIKGLGYKVVEVWERDWVKGKKAVVAIQKLWKMRSK